MTDRPSPYDCFTVADQLIDYADQVLLPEQTARVASHLSQCPACQEQVAQLRELSVQMEAIEPAKPSPALRNQFLLMLEKEKAVVAAAPVPAPEVREARIRTMWPGEVSRWAMRIAAGVALLVMGMVLGQQWQPENAPTVTSAPIAGSTKHAMQLANALSGDASQSLSASDRIQLVDNAVEQVDATGDPAVQVLINTLNFDPNSNVRLAAANALYRLRTDPRVGEAFIQSLTIQTDPNVQILLIELLVNMRERRAAPQLEQLANKPDALPIVRQQAEYGLGTLI
ncbi:HEAT repeat domain-containing protein [Hymenobacter sp. BT730]|uniref:HEAT repeat domain-containing protein n=1 Tax=Hymenobacter sp. BT730 TaxID=3063332 RepID=UPI0026DF4144|nr:HEAT repeat domain-containing protein [Hymenobacter sp. BT730]